jgi:O-antigen biosynthesis protein
MENNMDDITAVIEADKAWKCNDIATYFEWISKGLKYNWMNYELYLMLGQYYALTNVNQAYLCFENALFYCSEPNDRKIIKSFITDLFINNIITVRKIAIILLSYNNGRVTKECIQSIRKYNDESTYDLFVIDNASIDGIQDWLKGQQDICCQFNIENKGFPAGCNQGIRLAPVDSDILLLNNDTILTPNALFWLRMGLYESDKVGATGSVSNSAVNYQQVKEEYEEIGQWLEYGRINNIPIKYPYESKGWLVGFAMLVKRTALEKVGYLDERFTPGNYEDNDLSIRLLLEGYKLLLCKNSFIYHYGSKSFKKKSNDYYNLLRINEQKLAIKWEYNYIPYSVVNSYILEAVMPKAGSFNVLEIGCKLGCTLSRISAIFPNAYVIGTEHRERLYKLAKTVINVLDINFEAVIGELDTKRYDYIIIDHSLNSFKYPENVLFNSKHLLNSGGKIILSFNNIDYIGNQDNEGFSLGNIIRILDKLGLNILDIAYIKGEINEKSLKGLCEDEVITDEHILLYTATTFVLTLSTIINI